ncbi:MAG: hypothetical protein A2Y62_18205 [Candidatus Fischerbacteria bacterium RBG_13_37_8]|uniref:Uncharacterized protein n=1 Tax=Candidatus Fischerbacteria bacterium RBG_13_37_8 TaxID=1817863 RepID=A0A1F5VVV4_9BACT|nr:MAG: hypothetical protein A2Y62_18205 [Candidatus Fischerbacteria bacterium RBG_13_37_8]
MKRYMKNLYLLIIIISLLAHFGCSKKEKEMTEVELKQYLDSQEQMYEDISGQMATALWNFYNGEANADLKTPKQRFYQLFNDATLNATIDKWYGAKDTIQDPAITRRVVIWRTIIRSGKVNLNPEIVNMEEQLYSYLIQADKQETKPAAEEIQNKIVELMKLRNAKAKEAGYTDYAFFVLESSNLGSVLFNKAIDEIERITRKPYEDLITQYKKEIRKKDIEFSAIKELLDLYAGYIVKPEVKADKIPSIAKETLANIGINYDTLPLHIEEKQLPVGMERMGFALKIPSDYRIILSPGTGLEGRMNELGRAFNALFNKSAEPILKGYEGTIGSTCDAFMEGMADIGARIVRNPEWLIKFNGMTDKKIKSDKEKAFRIAPLYLRYLLSDIMLEIELYKNPEQNFMEARDTIMKKYLLLDKPMTDPIAQSTYMMMVIKPVYKQNYLIGNIISFQVHLALEKKFGRDYVFNTKAGEFLRQNLYADGELYSWQTRIKMATGSTLDVRNYLRTYGQ